VHDSWWEVQAQLLLLTSQLLTYIAVTHGGKIPKDLDAETDQRIESLLLIVARIFGAPGTSKIVLQVGLSSLVNNLSVYPTLLPGYVQVLLRQPPGLRQRLLDLPPKNEDGTPVSPRRLAYVMGTSSRLYEECCICDHWPALDVARTLADTVNSGDSQLANFEPEHLEVLTACLPTPDVDLGSEWLVVFDKIKLHIFVALVDPVLHLGATNVVRRFWQARPQSFALKALKASEKVLLQTLRILYCDLDRQRVKENEMLTFLGEMRNSGGEIPKMLQNVVDQFREVNNTEFQRSNLETLFD